MSRQLEILTTAGKLFSERGYHGTTVRDLAEALHIQNGSLYAHITSKEELLWKIIEEIDNLLVANAEAVSQDLPPEEQMKQLVRAHLILMGQTLPYATVYLQEWRFLTAELQERSKAVRQAYEARFRKVVEAGVERGNFWVEDVNLATKFVLTTLNGIFLWFHPTFRWFNPDGPLSLEEIAEMYVTHILRALGSTGELVDRYSDLVRRATKEK